MRKESTEIAVLVMRLHLYRSILQQRTVSLPSLLRGAWLAPPLGQLHLTLPESKDQVLRVMHTSHSNTWEVCFSASQSGFAILVCCVPVAKALFHNCANVTRDLFSGDERVKLF